MAMGGRVVKAITAGRQADNDMWTCQSRHLTFLGVSRHQEDGKLLRHTTVCPYTLYTGAMRLDGPTLANLELVESAEGGRQAIGSPPSPCLPLLPLSRAEDF